MKFNIWKTINLGCLTEKFYLESIMSMGSESMNDRALWYIRRYFEKSIIETNVDLVVIDPSELGFENGATYKEFFIAAFFQGFDVCSDEVPLALRVNYLDQPDNELIQIAMWNKFGGNLSLLCSVGSVSLFSFYLTSKKLIGEFIESSYVIGPKQKFVFCIRKQKAL